MCTLELCSLDWVLCLFLLWVCLKGVQLTPGSSFTVCVPVKSDIIENIGYSEELVGGVSLSALVDLAEHMVSVLWAFDCLSCVLSAQCQSVSLP